MDEKLKAEVDAALAAVEKKIADAVAAQVGKLGESVAELAKNHKIFADTYTADQTKAAEAAKAAAAAGDKGTPPQAGQGDKDAPAALTPEAVTKLVADALAADRKAQQSTAEQKAEREAFLNNPANGLAKLPDPFKAQLGADPAKWADEAKQVTASWSKFAADNKITIPDVGGAARDGGTPPGGAGGAAGGDAGAAKSGFLKMAAA